MTERSFSLIPFPAPNIPAVTITGRYSLQNQLLVLAYSLTGDLQEVLLPPASLNPIRKDELWKATCFEFFLAIKHQPGYWEFNMSPSGDWNVYRMGAYRRVGFREEPTISQLQFEFKNGTGECSLDLSVDLAAFIPLPQELEMAVTAILQTKGGGETYWALVHPAPQADFHLRESFILPLAGRTHPSEQSALAG